MTDLPSFLAPTASIVMPTDVGSASDLGGGPAPQSNQVVGFTMTCQLELQWCWAAVTQSVEDWRSVPVSQSSVASTHIDPHATGMICAHPLHPGTPASVCAPCSRGCGGPHSLKAVLDERGRLVQGGARQSLPSFSDIETAVDGQRPLPVRIEWGGNNGHFVCVTGYATDAAGVEWVTVHDPLLPGVGAGPATDQDMRYSVFAAAYPATDGTTGTPNFFYEVQ